MVSSPRWVWCRFLGGQEARQVSPMERRRADAEQRQAGRSHACGSGRDEHNKRRNQIAVGETPARMPAGSVRAGARDGPPHHHAGWCGQDATPRVVVRDQPPARGRTWGDGTPAAMDERVSVTWPHVRPHRQDAGTSLVQPRMAARAFEGAEFPCEVKWSEAIDYGSRGANRLGARPGFSGL